MTVAVREAWIERASAGKSFAEVGGLWGTVNEQVTVAARAGANRLTMVDTASEETGLWQLFHERCQSLGVDSCQSIQLDINDVEGLDSIGCHDTVHCSGVVYHCPHPLITLQNLHRITGKTLILGSATIPERVENIAGSIQLEPGSAIWVPACTPDQLSVLSQFLMEVNATNAIGVTAAHDEWNINDYGPWWWFFTPDFLRGMLETVGFRVREMASYWEDRATLYWADRI